MTRAERIAFVSPRFAEGATVGGAETLLKNLAQRLAAAGRQVTFLTTCAQNHFTWANDLPAGSRRVGNMDVMFFPVDQDRNIDEFLRVQNAISRRVPVSEADEEIWFANNVNSRALQEHLKSHLGEYDRIVMGPYLFGLIYYAAMSNPEKTVLVPCLHDEAFAYLSFIRRMFQSVERIMFNADPERDLANRLYDLEPARCSVVGMGIDRFDADRRAFAARRGLKAPYVIYSGRREPLKGTPLLMDYVQAFRDRTGTDIKVVLTGSGQVDIPGPLAPHVLDVGFVSEQEKHEAMAGAVAFVHPSVNESLSIVLLESWLARTPAMVHARSEVMQDHCRKSNGGLWFKSYPEFEEELQLLLAHPALRDAMGEAGRRYVLQEYSWARVEERLLAALDGP